MQSAITQSQTISGSTSWYRITSGEASRGAWFLDDPIDENAIVMDPRRYTEGRNAESPRPAYVPIYRNGYAASFSMGSFDIPVVSGPVAETLRQHCPDSVQLLPVLIPGQRDIYYIANFLDLLDCVDEERTQVSRWELGDGRDDRIGEYRVLMDITLCQRVCEGNHAFRIRGWEICLVVSDRLRNALLQHGNLAIGFNPIPAR